MFPVLTHLLKFYILACSCVLLHARCILEKVIIDYSGVRSCIKSRGSALENYWLLLKRSRMDACLHRRLKGLTVEGRYLLSVKSPHCCSQHQFASKGVLAAALTADLPVEGSERERISPHRGQRFLSPLLILSTRLNNKKWPSLKNDAS